jgi:hypothetical protein
MSSTPPGEFHPDEPAPAGAHGGEREMRAELARWLQRDVTRLEWIGGGRNSRVYRVAIDRAPPVALKAYFRHPADQRDRLATEFGSFSHLWANGFREIPQPLASHPGLGWAVYQFIEGDKIPSGQVSDADLLAAADFLGRLRELSRQPESRKLGVASEACFSVEAVLVNLNQRLGRLRALGPETAPHQTLGDFLAGEFTPLLDQVTRWSESHLRDTGVSFPMELSWPQRTLSPSDFGFHNALRQRDGRIIFLDFEYFGWDDPAKMIADFLLHPAMDLAPGLKRKFVSAVLRRFAEFPGLRGRVESVYPLFGLKWCLIMLNEFLPNELLRRQFASAAGAERSALQRQQLAKARELLNRIRREYECFPYCD